MQFRLMSLPALAAARKHIDVNYPNLRGKPLYIQLPAGR